MTKAMSSLLPLIAEHIYLGLNPSEKSVHLTNFPKLEEIKIEHELVAVMDQVLDICSTALFIRSAENIRVRQPLSAIKIITENSNKFQEFIDLIKNADILISNFKKGDDLKLNIQTSYLHSINPQLIIGKIIK